MFLNEQLKEILFIEKMCCSILMTEAYGNVTQMTKYYGEVRDGEIIKYGSHIPFNFLLRFLKRWAKSSDFIKSIDSWIDYMPKGVGIQPNWVVSIFHGQISSMASLDIFIVLVGKP